MGWRRQCCLRATHNDSDCAVSNSDEAVVFPRLSDWLAVSVAYLPNTANLPEDGSTNASRHADAVATPMGNNCSLGGTPHILLQ